VLRVALRSRAWGLDKQMRSYTHAFLGLIPGAILIVVLAGCGKDESAPPVHARNLGTEPGEVLVPYEPTVSRMSRFVNEPNQYPMPAMPTAVTAEAPVTAEAAEVPEDEYVTAARELVDALAKADYESVVARFDETLKAQLPPAQLQATWEAVNNQAGAFQEVAGVRREQVQGSEVAVVTGKFERGSVDIRVVFNADKAVAGLFLVPARAPSQNLASTPPSPEAEELARQFADSLAKGDFAAAAAAVPSAGTADEIRDMWNRVAADSGAFKGIADVTQEASTMPMGGQGTKVTVSCQFDNGYIDVAVLFDDSGKPGGYTVGTGAPPGTPVETITAPADTSGSSGGMDMLPPTAPAPVGIGQ